MHGYARQSKGTVPYGLWGHSEDIFQYSYNLTKAKQLLAQAGHPNGGFSLVYTYNAGDEYERRSGELYKSELAKLGITVDLRGMPWEQQWAMATAENPADRQDIFVMYWWPDYPDPYTFLGPMFHSEQTIVFNFGYYSNPEYDKLIDDAASMAGTNRDQALAMITQAQQKLVQDAPAIFFFDQEYTRAKRTNLMGYVDNPVYAHVVFWYDCYREG
jgi:peptide/nickel transport system substrate-binding protein